MVSGPSRRRARPRVSRGEVHPTLTVATERRDSTHLIQMLCQVLDGLKHRASALNTLAPTTRAEPESYGLINIIESLESLDGPLQVLEKAWGFAVDFICPVKHCRRAFTRQDSLHRHIRKTTDANHTEAKELLDRRTCIPCSFKCTTSTGLRRHNKAYHPDLDEDSEEVANQTANGEKYADRSHRNSDQASSLSTSDSSCIMALKSDAKPSCTSVSPINSQSFHEPQPDIDRTNGSSMPSLNHCFTTMNPPLGNTQGLPIESSLYAAPQTSDRSKLLSTLSLEYHINTRVSTIDNNQALSIDSLQTNSDHANPLSTSKLEDYFNTVVPTNNNTQALPVHSLQTDSDHATPLLTSNYEDYFNTVIPINNNTQALPVDTFQTGSDYANFLSPLDSGYYFDTLDRNSTSIVGSGFQSSGV